MECIQFQLVIFLLNNLVCIGRAYPDIVAQTSHETIINQ